MADKYTVLPYKPSRTALLQEKHTAWNHHAEQHYKFLSRSTRDVSWS